MPVNDSSLDWKSQAILVSLNEAGGSASTTEIRTLTGIDNNDIVRYRFTEKLAKQGLIETHRGESDGTQLAPTIATLTEAGQERAERLDEERESSMDLSDEVEQLRAELKTLQTRVDKVEESAASVEVNDLTERVDLLWEGMAAIRDYLRGEHDADLESYLPVEDAESQETTT